MATLFETVQRLGEEVRIANSRIPTKEEEEALTARDLTEEDVLSLFGLEWDPRSEKEIWTLPEDQKLKVPGDLFEWRNTQFQLKNLLTSCIAIVTGSHQGDDKGLELCRHTGLKFPFTYEVEEEEEHVLHLTADYSIWYGSGEQLATNFVIRCAAYGYMVLEFNSCLAWMGAIHNARKEAKQDACVYGLISDDVSFVLLRIDNSSKVSMWRIFSPERQNLSSFYTHLQRILGQALQLSRTAQECRHELRFYMEPGDKDFPCWRRWLIGVS